MEIVDVEVYYDYDSMEYIAAELNYCGCPDCQDPIGYGNSEQEALDDLEQKLVALRN